MRFEFKETRLLDDSKVFDVNIFANSNPDFGHKCIFSCQSEKDALMFLAKLTKAIEDHTVEQLKEI